MYKSETIICVCGRAWAMQRHALPKVCQDAAICLCGQTLKTWNEAADYIFEPTGDWMACTEGPLQRLWEEWPSGVNAPLGDRINREH